MCSLSISFNIEKVLLSNHNILLFVLFDLILYVPDFQSTIFQFCQDGSSTKQGLLHLTQEHNAVVPVRLEPATPQSLDKHSSTIEPLRSPHNTCFG